MSTPNPAPEAHVRATLAALRAELEVSPGNPRARALYEALGFRPVRNAVLRWGP